MNTLSVRIKRFISAQCILIFSIGSFPFFFIMIKLYDLFMIVLHGLNPLLISMSLVVLMLSLLLFLLGSCFQLLEVDVNLGEVDFPFFRFAHVPSRLR